ncbi:MAG: M20/M25/M40 family metallo-hydrolase [Deltaproteobacteria bacterium]|nr:M20/M25/M40 family metallo-hydrolase [Deltaproteobacteria bacterium]
MSKQRLKDLFLSLVAVHSPSGQEGKIGRMLEVRLADLGFEVTLDGVGKLLNGEMGNIIARKDGDTHSETVLLCAHMDTVKPIGSAVIENGVFRSRGAGILGADDKGGIAAILEGVQRVIETMRNHPPIEVVFTVQEEVGLNGARHLDTSQLCAKCGFVFDASGDVGSVTIHTPAKRSLEYIFTGRAAHAGVEPEKGVSAIVAASKAIAAMTLGRVSEESTANIGVIEGGVAKNIVPESTRLVGEARSFSEDKLSLIVAEMAKRAQEAAASMGARVEINEVEDYPAICLDVSDKVVQDAASAIRGVGIEPHFSKEGGGSDAVILTTRGIPCVNLGIGVSKPHTSMEHIALEDLDKAAQLVFQIVMQGSK